MSVLKITAFKAVYREFQGYSHLNAPQFLQVEHMHVFGSFNTEVSAARYVVDDLIKNWNLANGTLPEYFRVECGTADKIYKVRPSEAGETPDLSSPVMGDYYFKPEYTLRG